MRETSAKTANAAGVALSPRGIARTWSLNSTRSFYVLLFTNGFGCYRFALKKGFDVMCVGTAPPIQCNRLRGQEEVSLRSQVKFVNII